MSKRDISSPRRRYTRSSTASVTQLLSDSCSSLLHRLTTRVRGPSQITESNSSKARNHVEIYSDVPTRQDSYWQKLIDSDKKHKAENMKVKRDRTEALKSDLKTSAGAIKNSFEKLFDQNSPGEIDENSMRRRIEEVNKEAENAADTKRGSKIFPKEIITNKAADEKPVKSRLLEDLSLNSLGATRMRLENKYSDALNKVVKRKRDLQRTQSPADFRLELTKSATTSSILLSEKAYPFVSSTVVTSRDKTPFRAVEDSSTRTRRHKSYKDEPHPTYRRCGPLRTDGSGALHLSGKPYLKICSIDIDKDVGKDEEKNLKDDTPKQIMKKCKEACIVDEATSEREIKRKEIQSLINKYAMLDEAYNRLSGKSKQSRTKEATLRHTSSTQTVVRSKVAGVSRWFGVCSVKFLTNKKKIK